MRYLLIFALIFILNETDFCTTLTNTYAYLLTYSLTFYYFLGIILGFNLESYSARCHGNNIGVFNYLVKSYLLVCQDVFGMTTPPYIRRRYLVSNDSVLVVSKFNKCEI